jgi:hypothetical protein
MSAVGRSPSLRGVSVLATGAVAVVIVVSAAAATTTSTTTTTTTRPPRPGVFTPTVSPTTIDNRWGCDHPTSATISTGTTGKVDRVTFHVQVGGRTSSLSATPSGSRWSARLSSSTFSPDHGAGSVWAEATGPSGTAESGDGHFTVADCPN